MLVCLFLQQLFSIIDPGANKVSAKVGFGTFMPAPFS